jgi:hypothetical protein
MLTAMVQAPMFLWVLFIVVGVVGSIITLGTIVYVYVKELKRGDLW